MLSDMLQYAAEATGVRDVNSATRAQLLRYINRAGRELYEKYDLPGTVLEVTACVDPTEGQITLPWYVDQIRAARRAEIHQPITLHDIRPRYHDTPWRQRLLEWRVKKRVALHTPLSVESTLTFTLAEAQTETIQISVAGQTADAGSSREVVTIEVGETTATTTTQWAREQPIGIDTISKNAITTCDVVVTQTTGGTEVSSIANRLTSAVFVLVQVNDYAAGTNTQEYCVDIAFKRPYTELYYDNDVFGDSRLEDALIWKLRAHFCSMSNDPNVVSLAPGHSGASESLIRQIISNQSKEVQHEMSFTSPGGERAWVYGWRYRRGIWR
jgi:hypothetical protein